MNFWLETPALLLRSTLLLTIAASLVALAVHWRRSQSSRFQAACWTMVLVIGVLLWPATFDVPWYAPVSSDAFHATTESLDGYSLDAESIESPSAKQAAAPDTQPRASAANATISLTRIAAGIWMLGLLAVGGVAACGYLGLLLALRSSWRPQKTWQEFYQRTARVMGVKSPPKLVVHAELGPCVCWTPLGSRLVIPSAEWTGLNSNQRRAVLKHELAHFIRCDVWRALPARLVVLIHWFNPLAWLAASRLDECSELAADRLALKNEPWLAGDLAAALLQFAHNNSQTRIMASAAGGRSLTRRLTQLIDEHEPQGEKRMLTTRIPLFVLLAGLVTAGAVQVNLVAQEESEANAVDGASQLTVEMSKAFAQKLSSDDDLHKQLQSALQSEAGALALRDRAGHYEAEAREEAREEAIPRLMESIFSDNGQQLALRPDRQDFRDEFLTAAEKVNGDIEQMKKTLQAKAAKMAPKSEVEKIVHRFLTDESAPIILYARELRPRLRPGVKVVEQILNGSFALRRDGKYALRPDARPQAEERAEQYAAFEKLFKTFQGDIADLAADISQHDAFHKNLRKTFMDPFFSARLGAEVIEGGRASRSKAEKIISQLEEALREGAEGLVLKEEGRGEVEEFLTEFEQIKKASTRMRKPLRDFAALITDEDKLNRDWKRLLQSDVALIRVAGKVEYATADAGDAVEEFLSQFLAEQDDGSIIVQSAEADDQELIEGISNIFRQSRSARRRGRELDQLTERIKDEPLRKMFQTSGGKIVLADHLTRHLAGIFNDGFQQWITDHFETVGGRYQIRDDAKEEIQELIEQVQDIKRELDNADF